MATEKERVAELIKQGEALAAKIRSSLTSLISEDVYAFDQIRIELGRQFREIGGEAAAVNLRELIFKRSPSAEGVRTPELHLRDLEDQGWAARYNHGLNEVPGGNLHFSVVSMRPKPKA